MMGNGRGPVKRGRKKNNRESNKAEQAMKPGKARKAEEAQKGDETKRREEARLAAEA
jgi:hypothetical protein